jgi:LPS O-antigen subunit length determinant protein (WzzB/FepE family)
MEFRLNEKDISTKPRDQIADGISFSELIVFFYKSRKLVLCSFLGVLCVGFGALAAMENTFSTTMKIKPPTRVNIQQLLFFLDPLDVSVTTDTVFQRLISNLQDNRNKEQFFESNNLLQHITKSTKGGMDEDDYRRIRETFFDQLTINSDSEFTFADLKLIGSERKKVEIWLTAYLKYVSDLTVAELVSDARSKMDTKVDDVERQLMVLPERVKLERNTRIALLKESLVIAEDLKLHEFTLGQNAAKFSESGFNEGSIPFYFLGTKAIKSELEMLESRKEDLWFARDYAMLTAQRNLLKSIKIDENKVSTYRLAKAATIPVRIKPNYRLTAALVVLCALFAAFVVPLGMNFIRNLPKLED